MKKLKDQTDLSGILGERVSIRKVNGRVIITNLPKRKKGKPTKKLLAQRSTFKEASMYAKAAAADPEVRALYAARITGKFESPYTVAVRDFMNPPKINAIDAASYFGAIGDPIFIAAVDDFKVTNVKIVITDINGVVIEQGDATDDRGTRINQWQYKATSINSFVKGSKIVATAYDRPGNKGTMEIIS